MNHIEKQRYERLKAKMPSLREEWLLKFAAEDADALSLAADEADYEMAQSSISFQQRAIIIRQIVDTAQGHGEYAL